MIFDIFLDSNELVGVNYRPFFTVLIVEQLVGLNNTVLHRASMFFDFI